MSCSNIIQYPRNLEINFDPLKRVFQRQNPQAHPFPSHRFKDAQSAQVIRLFLPELVFLELRQQSRILDPSCLREPLPEQLNAVTRQHTVKALCYQHTLFLFAGHRRGFLTLACLSDLMARANTETAWRIIGEHAMIAGVVVLITHWVGDWLGTMAQ
jgi:hypothetical protein